MIVYADTSALAKLLLDEQGSAEIRAAAISADRVVTVAVGYIELRSAMAAAIRAGRLGAGERDRIAARLEEIWAQTFIMQVEMPLVGQAGNLTEQMRLRAYDALHLAGLLQLGEPGELGFACWDVELRTAAATLGYPLIPERL